MNDRELMKKIYDRRCADEMTAAELLEGSTEAARIKSRAPVCAAAAAAVVLGVGTAMFVKYNAVPQAAGEPSSGRAEEIAAADSSAFDGTSSDPWEPNAVSMPDPFRQDGMTPVTDHNGTESRDVIEFTESTGNGSDSSQAEEPQYSEELGIKQTEEQFLAHLSQSGTEITAVFDDVYLQDITAAENAEQLKSLSKSRCYVLPADSTSGNHFHYAEFNSGSERMRYNAGTGELAPVLSSEVLEQKLSFYPDHSEIKKFRIANVGSFTELYCFTSGGRELVIPYDPDRQAVPNAISEYPLNGQVYSFDAIRTWAGRKRQFSHYSENSVVCCDLAEKDERVYTVTEEQLLQLREWYKAHEADEVNVPADGSQGDRRFLSCEGAAYAGFPYDGASVVISRYYGCEDSAKGIAVTVTGADGNESVRWYGDDIFPDTKVITELFDRLYGGNAAVFVWNDQTKADGFGDEYFDVNAFSGTFTLDAFPGVEFKWEDSRISVTENGKVIDIRDHEPKDHFYGMPIWNAYFTDLNGDSYPELCVTASDGSGIIDTYIYVYDHRNRKNYSLRDRMKYDYGLLMEGEELTVKKTPYNWGNDWEKLSRETVFGSLAIENDELVFKEN